MDATTSFVYLTDNLPKWIEQVKGLSTYTSKKHAEYVAEYNRRLACIRPKIDRTPSTQSIHTDKDKPLKPRHESTDPPSESTPKPLAANDLHISPLEAGNRYLLAQAQRKRKLGSTIRSGVSGRQKFRSKHMVVIYYDSYLQEQLESLVKSTGAARNNLRKGKLSHSAARGFQLPSLSRDTEHGSIGIPSFTSCKRPTSSLRLPTDPKVALTDHRSTNDVAFTEADKYLEAAQTLCETAAHQVLRDGGCTTELDNVVTKLQSALELATVTVEKLREEDARRQKAEDENQTLVDAATILAGETACSPSPTQSSTSKLVPPLDQKMEFPSRALATCPGAVTEIEVDDNSDQSSIVVDISKFRSTRTRSHAPWMVT